MEGYEDTGDGDGLGGYGGRGGAFDGVLGGVHGMVEEGWLLDCESL